MLRTILLILSLCTGCGSISASDLRPHNSPVDPRSTHDTDEEFLRYVEEFRRDCGVEVTDTPISFKEQEVGILGSCNWSGPFENKKYKSIEIDREKWEELRYWERKWLIYHELGHCTLDREHLNKYDKLARPKSLMVSHLPVTASFLFYTRERYYINELCGSK